MLKALLRNDIIGLIQRNEEVAEKDAIIEQSKAEIEQRDAENERQNARIRELEEMLSKK